MDALKAQLARVQQQLSQLTASQRMLAASLVAVMVLSLLFWARYAGTSEMEPVLDQSMKPDEMGRITTEIRRMNVEYKIVGDRIMVPTDRKLEVIAGLSYANATPQDTNNAYEEIVSKINPFDSQANSDARRLEAKGAYLTQVIRRWPGVSSADVIIDATNERRIGSGRHPTASVQVTTRDGGKPDKNLVRSAAATVAGAQSGLKRSQVTVVVNGMTYRVPDDDPSNPGGLGGADEILSVQQEAERFFATKISEQLAFIPNVLVKVTVEVDPESRRKSETLFDPKSTVSKEAKTDSETVEETTSAPASNEPGAVMNAPLSVNSGAPAGSVSGGGTTSTKQRETAVFENHVGKSQIESQMPAGRSKVTGATVRVPRSYFVTIYRMNDRSGSSKDPDDEALKPIIAAQTPQIRDDVKRCTDIKTDEQIAVSPYLDVMPPMLAASQSTPSVGAGGGFAAMFSGHYKEIGVGVLAVMSLFMVSSMVKKSNVPSPVMAAPMDFGEVPTLATDDDIAGDVGEGGSLLDGIEMDADAVKAQQMVEQVSTMVKENPDAAATLVKRWLNRT